MVLITQGLTVLALRILKTWIVAVCLFKTVNRRARRLFTTRLQAAILGVKQNIHKTLSCSSF